MELSLEALGLSKEDVADRVVERIAEQLLSSYATDEDGELVETGHSPFKKMLQDRIIARVNQSIDEIAAKHVLPNVTSYLENLCLQETNQWGEKKGKPVSFIEYLVQRAEAYLQEPVSHQGKTQKEDTYNWRSNTTRVSYLIHEHLQYAISTAMKTALDGANKTIVGGIEKAVRIALEQVAGTLKVDVKTK